MTTVRDNSFDILKGVLILLVVFGHSVQDVCVYNGIDPYHVNSFNFVYLFHMPLFVFVSGYFSHSIANKRFSEVFKSKALRLLLPWFVWSSIDLMLNAVLGHIEFNGLSSIASSLFYQYTKIWYLVCVFVLSIVYYPIIYFCKGGGNKFLILSLGIVVLWILSLLFADRPVIAAVNMLQISRQFLVFGLGVLYYYQKDKIKVMHIAAIAALALIGILINFHFNGVWFGDYTLEQKIFNGLCFTVIMFVILKFVSNKLSQLSGLCRPIIWLGQNSLAIYVIHMIGRTICKQADIVNTGSFTLDSLCVMILYLVFSLSLTLIIKKLFNDKSYIFGV